MNNKEPKILGFLLVMLLCCSYTGLYIDPSDMDIETQYDASKNYRGSFTHVETGEMQSDGAKQHTTHYFDRQIPISKNTINSEDEKFRNDYFRFNYPVELSSDEFGSSKTADPIEFNNFLFNAPLSITLCSYYGYLTFEHSLFTKNVDIYNKADDDSKSAVKCDFENCTFENGICFNSQIRNDDSSETEGFEGTRFKDGLYFGDCKIAGALDLSGCIFDSTGSLNFDGKTQVDYIDLSHVKSASVINLPPIKRYTPGSSCLINLTGADISKIQFQYQNFKLVFPEKLIKNEKYSDIITSTYEALLANFTKNGYTDSHDRLDIEYLDYKYRAYSLFGVVLPHYWNCYGYHKKWIFYWTAFFIFIFTLITLILYPTLNREIVNNGVYHMESIPKQPTSWAGRLWYSFMYTCSLFFELTLDFDKLNFKRLRSIYVIIVYSIGILCIGYMANFVLQK